MSRTHRLAALVLALASLAATAPARAMIDYPGSDPKVWQWPQHLGATPAPGGKDAAYAGPDVVIVQNGNGSADYGEAQGFPGGCFNCGTLRPNDVNTELSLARSHTFSQGLFNSFGDRRALFLFGR